MSAESLRHLGRCCAVRRLLSHANVVGADNPVTSCDLGIFMDRAADPVPAQNAHTGHFGRRIRASGRRLLPQCPVRTVGVVVVGDAAVSCALAGSVVRSTAVPRQAITFVLTAGAADAYSGAMDLWIHDFALKASFRAVGSAKDRLPWRTRAMSTTSRVPRRSARGRTAVRLYVPAADRQLHRSTKLDHVRAYKRCA